MQKHRFSSSGFLKVQFLRYFPRKRNVGERKKAKGKRRKGKVVKHFQLLTFNFNLSNLSTTKTIIDILFVKRIKMRYTNYGVGEKERKQGRMVDA